MNKIKILFGMLLFTLFIPSVNALKYEIGTSAVNVSDSDKTLYEVKVSIKNITDTDYGVGSCSMNINLSGDVKFNGTIRTLGGWSMMAQEVYLFDTGSPALKDTDFMLIPVKVSGSGTITISNIYCSDGEEDVFIENKDINLKYIPSSNDTQSGNNQNNNIENNNDSTINDNNDRREDVKLDSNCDLSNIILSEGTIDFDSNITDYEVDVYNIDNLVVEPKLASDKATYTITKNEDSVVIIVVAQDGSSKTYTIYVGEKVNNSSGNEKNSYVPIFIAIICVLVLINVFRVVKNMKSKS